MAFDREKIKAEFLLKCAGWQDGYLSLCYNSDLMILFDLYAQNVPEAALKEIKGVTVRYFGRRDSKCAGTFRQKEGKFFVELNPYPFMRLQKSNVEEVSIDGIRLKTALDCALLVFEHELTHLIERARYGSTGHGKRFKALASSLFGHDPKKAVGHTLPVMTKAGVLVPDAGAGDRIKAGDKVQFVYGGKMIFGTVARVTKRATVIADEGEKKGVKFYVPPALLRPRE